MCKQQLPANAKSVFLDKLEMELRQLDASFASLSKKAGRAEDAVRTEYQERAKLFTEMRTVASQRLKTLRHCSEASWEMLKRETEEHWWELGHAFDEIDAFIALSGINGKHRVP